MIGMVSRARQIDFNDFAGILKKSKDHYILA